MKTALKAIYDELRYSDKVASQTDFGNKLGFTKSYTSALLKNGTVLPNNVQDKVSKAFGVNPRWLASNGKEGNMFIEKVLKNKTGNNDIKVEDLGANDQANLLNSQSEKSRDDEAGESADDEDYTHNPLTFKQTEKMVMKLIAIVEKQQTNESDFARAMNTFAEAHRDVAAALKNLTARKDQDDDQSKSNAA
jgi:hypothetical protein